MTWKLIELELGRTPEFPEGSSSHSYLMRVPVTDEGLIDGAELKLHPELATVRRSFPAEQTRLGSVVATSRGFGFSYAPGEDDDEMIVHLDNHRLEVGNYVTIVETDGERLPFKVASVEQADPCFAHV